MKVYVFYLTLKDGWDNFCDENDKDWMTILKPNLKSLAQFWLNDYCKYIYAITDNKEYAKMFKELHDDSLFDMKKLDLSKHEFEMLKEDNNLAVLGMHNIEDIWDSIETEDKILCTKNELVIMNEDGKLLLNMLMAEYSIWEYDIFDNKYIEALDIIQYCINNRINSDECDYYSTQLSYGCTPEGTPYRRMIPNIHSLYLKIFKPFLRKDEK